MTWFATLTCRLFKHDIEIAGHSEERLVTMVYCGRCGKVGANYFWHVEGSFFEDHGYEPYMSDADDGDVLE